MSGTPGDGAAAPVRAGSGSLSGVVARRGTERVDDDVRPLMATLTATADASRAANPLRVAPDPNLGVAETELTARLARLCEAVRVPGSSSAPLRRVELFSTARSAVTAEVMGTSPTQPWAEHFMHFNDRMRMRYFYDDQRKMMYAAFQFTERAEGPPALVHGGSLGSAIDVALGTHAILFANGPMLTRSLSVAYERAVPLNSVVVVRSWIEAHSDRATHVTCDVVTRDTDADTGALARHCRGTAVLMPFPAKRRVPLSMAVSDVGALVDRYVSVSERIESGLRVGERRTERVMEPFPDLPPGAVSGEHYRWESLFEGLLSERGGFRGLHVATHFDFHPHGTMAFKLYRGLTDPSLAAAAYFSPESVGPHTVHGGAIFALCDAVLGDAVFVSVGWGYMTASLQVEMLRSIPLRSVAVFRGIHIAAQGRTATAVTRLEDLSGTLLAKARGVFVTRSPPLTLQQAARMVRSAAASKL